MNANEEQLAFAPLTPLTLESCAQITLTAPDPWNQQHLTTAMEDVNRWTFVALRGDTPLGFACFLAVTDSADLEILAVHPDARRQNIATSLLQHSFAELGQYGIKHCLLEVRASNENALALYQKLGFRTLARRPALYTKPVEDGFLLGRGLHY